MPGIAKCLKMLLKFLELFQLDKLQNYQKDITQWNASNNILKKC